ncbi:hypothetical protein GSI_06634 [Ganoderma sinense ZZ0214-1]|uniref:Uncharacterized protein n=1 Tax=Ganoderma sinense ZZ0214-1 TaxID=1077348 RepID=A0A2G8SDT1_9APHY|nr:hypothetical protein GSI_06634 [Ganoderma sinense ZZ0214-1]
MAPAILDEGPSAANAIDTDDIVVERTYLKDTDYEEGAFPGEPNKENVAERHDNEGDVEEYDLHLTSRIAATSDLTLSSTRSASEGDLFDDESDDGGDEGEFVPRGNATRVTSTIPLKAAPGPVKASVATNNTDKDPKSGNVQDPKDKKNLKK